MHMTDTDQNVAGEGEGETESDSHASAEISTDRGGRNELEMSTLNSLTSIVKTLLYINDSIACVSVFLKH